MKRFIKLTTLLFLVLFTSSVWAQDVEIDTAKIFDKASYKADTLLIKTQFVECGEWGGHIELIKVYLKGNDFHLQYQKYNVGCDKMKDSTAPSQTLAQQIDKELLENHKHLINLYAYQLFETKSLLKQKRKRLPNSNVGYIYEINKSSEGFNIRVFTLQDRIKDDYLRLIKLLTE